jgi:hypothetical protein
MITTHSTVTATVEDTWMTLADLSGYARWNPFIIAAAGDVRACERLDLIILPPGGHATVSRPWVTAVEPPRCLEWLGRAALPGVLDGRHSFTLTAMPGGRTLLQQSATFTGVLAPFAEGVLNRTRAGFTAMNGALTRHHAQAQAVPDGHQVTPPSEKQAGRSWLTSCGEGPTPPGSSQ